MNKSEFLHTLQAERQRLEDKLAGLSEAQLTRHEAPEAWSIKDHLAHLTYWEQYMLDKIRRAVDQGETPQWVTDEEETNINARVYAENQGRPVKDVLAGMRRSLAQVVEQVQALSEEDLTDPNRFAWMKGVPLCKYIADEAYDEHYREHLKDLFA